MTNTQKFAVVELDILSKSCTDPDDRPLIEPFRKEILALCEKFGKSGQSGGSAPYTATCLSQAIKHLLLQECISPISGIEEEWSDVTEMNGGLPLYQNKRCSALFKCGIDGLPYYLDAIIFKDNTDGCWTGWSNINGNKVHSKQFIKGFPFTPKSFYINVIEKEGEEFTEFYIKTPEQLNKVWKYYKKS